MIGFREREVKVDLDKIAKDIFDGAERREGHLDYAPPRVREESQVLVKQVETFGELPTKELDDIVAAAEAEIAALKRDAQAVRDMYVKHTQRIAADIKRLQEGVRLSMDTMKALREQCVKLDEPLRIEESPTLQIADSSLAAADDEVRASEREFRPLRHRRRDHDERDRGVGRPGEDLRADGAKA